MYKTCTLFLDFEDLEACEIKVGTFERAYEPQDVVAIVRFDTKTSMQIKPDALRGFIEKLEAAEAEINKMAKEHIEDIRLRRHASVIPEDGQNVTAEELKSILQRNGTVTA